MFRSTWSALHGRRSRLAVAVVALGAGIGLGLPAVLPSAPAPPAAAEHGHTDPSAADYLAIAAAPVTAAAVPGPDASVGTFSADCGRNVDGHRNSDNFFVSPGVAGGAHHLHDYVGNTSTDRDSTDASLAAAGTTCTRDDRSTYYWPVLRVKGSILTPAAVSPDQLSKPVADHFDFEDVMPPDLMRQVVECINGGRTC